MRIPASGHSSPIYFLCLLWMLVERFSVYRVPIFNRMWYTLCMLKKTADCDLLGNVVLPCAAFITHTHTVTEEALSWLQKECKSVHNVWWCNLIFHLMNDYQMSRMIDRCPLMSRMIDKFPLMFPQDWWACQTHWARRTRAETNQALWLVLP